MGIRLSLIAAVANNNVIGAGGSLPWRLSSDLKRFKRLTMGKPIIMGRKTYEAIGRPLPGRLNIVVSRQAGLSPEGLVVVPTLDAALIKAREDAGDDGEIMVIGGGEIYRAAFERANRLYITHVDASPDGDTQFPSIDPADWRQTSSERLTTGDRDSAATNFTIYERIVSSRGG